MSKRILFYLCIACFALTCFYGQVNAQADSIRLPKKKMLGWYYHSSFGILPSLENTINYGYSSSILPLNAGYSIKGSAGYRFFNSLFLGGGVATEFFDNKSVNIPLFAELRGTFSKKKFTPFYQVHCGWGFPFLRALADFNNAYTDFKVKGGLSLGGGLGMLCRLDKFTNLTLGLSYRYQLTSYSYQLNNSYLYIQNYRYNRFELSIGFGFN